jgi:2-polyprenyl-3-methyl-5-hydroxy-6-metoxy-1,4-benzoquinol methylase
MRMHVLDAATRRAIAGRYDRPGQRYYVRGKLAIDPVYGATAQLVAEQRLPLLDIGCGIGLLAHYLHACRLLERYLGLDHDARKIDAGNAAAKQAGLDGQIQLRAADAATLQPVRGHVTMLDILHYLPRDRQPQLLRHAARHLAPNGRLILRNVIREPNWRFHATRVEEYFLRVSGWIPGGAQHYPSAEEIRTPLEEAGLRVSFRPLRGRTPYNSYLVVAEF